MWALMLRLALRPGEAGGLDWEDVDLTNATVNVRRTLQTDERGAVTTVDKLKVESARRTLGIPADLLPWLRQHRAGQAVVALNGSGPLFPGVDPSRARKDLTAICDRAALSVLTKRTRCFSTARSLHGVHGATRGPILVAPAGRGGDQTMRTTQSRAP